jgi:iron(III) transport system ATP-binding protein
MGEAMLFPGRALPDGFVEIGPVRTRALHAVPAGPVKVAIRPEAWRLAPAGAGGLGGTISKHAYLGSYQELTVLTDVGSIFVVSSDVARRWQLGDRPSLQLPERGVSVVPA